GPLDFSERGDAIRGDREIPAQRGRPEPVEEQRVADHEVEHPAQYTFWNSGSKPELFLYVDYFDFKNKTAVVTGGARGIGAATVALLRECGARVVSLDVAEGCDVTDEAAVKAAFERIGDIDILVNNAGRAARK